MLEAIGFGIVTASILALAGVAVSLQVSVANFINFAYGDFMTFGAYIAWDTNAHGVPLAAAVAIGGIATGALGVLVNIFIFRPFMRRGARTVTLLIAGVGVAFILQNAIILIWGSGTQTFPITLGSALHVGPFLWTPGELVMMGVSAALLATLYVVMKFTTIGKALRATSNNIELAQACGIDSERVINVMWFVAGILTAAAGVGLALQEASLFPTLGFTELFVIFGAVILGGVGRPGGAALGALVVGIVTEVAGAYMNPAYKTAIAFGVVIVLLLLRPQGLLVSSGKTN
jgi:branched-subunit amino acid ABC-type transport system permease component